MSARRHALAIGLLATVMHQTVWSQSDANQMLIDQGRFWQSKGNPERASEAWGKLLLVDPAQPEALYGMAQLAIKNKQLTQARQYLAKLRATNDSGQFVSRLEQDIALASGSGQSDIDQARKLAESASLMNDSAKLSQAIALYDKALAGKQPQGSVAREYYTYLGYTDGGLDRAIAGLERQVRDNPGDATTELALARHMVRGERTRAQGLSRLEKLSRNPEVSGAAAEIWRLGLVWLGKSNPEEKPLFEAYLKSFPNDEQIRKQMMDIPAAGRTTTRVSGASAPTSSASTAGATSTAASAPRASQQRPAGFDALQRGDVASAEREFIATLRQNPNQSDALGGLGVIRMQQNEMGQAQALLERAVAQPGSGNKWTKELNTARYWNLVAESAQAQSRGDLATARRQLDQAIRLDGRTPAARNAMARLQVENGDLAAGERGFRAVLANHKDDPEALSGLVGVLAQRGQSQEALKLIERLTPEQRSKIGGMSQLRASMATGRAAAAEQRGDMQGARNALESAMRDDPNNPWIRFDLARHYLQTGDRTQARGLVDGLLVSHPDSPDALYASTLLAVQLNEWDRAETTLARIPESRRTPAMNETARQIGLHNEIARASALAKAGRMQDANRVLAQLEPAAGRDPAQVGALAQAYVDAENPARGLSLLRQLVSGPSGDRPETLLPYAGVLLRTGQDIEAAGILRDLQRRNLDSSQRQQLTELNVLYTIRQAELLREKGDLVAAYDTLEPVLDARPNDPQALATLARMYTDSGDHAKALDLYKQLLNNNPDDANYHVAAAMAATQAKDNRYARTALETAVSLAPQDPEVLANAARVYRAQGKPGKAAELMAQAVALQQPQSPATRVADNRAPSPQVASSNPFVGMPGQRAQSTTDSRLDDSAGAMQPYPNAVAASVAPSAPLVAASMPQGSSSTARAVPPSSSRRGPSEFESTPARDRRVSPENRYAAPSGSSQYGRTAAAPVFTPEADAPVYVSRAAPAQAQPQAPSTALGRDDRFAPVDPRVSAPGFGSRAADQTALPARGAPIPTKPSLQDELDQIRADHSPEVRFGTMVRSNSGTSGASKLTMVEAPLEVLVPAGDGKLSFRVTPVDVSAGRVSGEINQSSQFGGGPVAALAQANGQVSAPGSQSDRGVGLSVGYEMIGLKGDIGTTPLGFRKTNIVGGVTHEGVFGESAWYNVGASRRAVTDSVLSFAGARDSRTGQTWGAVTASGVQGQIGTDMQDYGVYGYGAFHSLDGDNVKSNTRAEIGAGIYWKLLAERDQTLIAGLNLGGMFYDNNQRFYTYGHGGYFSPQEFYSLSIPVRWAARQERWNYKLEGSIGMQHFRESSADYFPTSGRLQNEAAAASRGAGLADGARYSGQSKTGVGYSLAGAAEYQMNRNLFLGGTLGLNNASDYRQWGGGLYLRYALYPQVNSMKMPLIPYGSPYVK